MSEPSAPVHPARGILKQLEQLLADERAALVQLDRESIEAFATRKLELDAELQSAAREAPLGASEKDLLEHVRQAALSNQLLLAHARSCVQGVLTLLSPAHAPGYAAPGAATSHTGGAQSAATMPPLALNFRR